MIINNFFRDVLQSYEQIIDHFFDHESGAIIELDREDGTPKFLFSEDTGNAILNCILLHSITGNCNYLQRAIRCSRWLKDVGQDNCGGFLTRYYFENDVDPKLSHYSFSGRMIHSFDTAIIIKALCKLYSLTEDISDLHSADRAGKFLVNNMISEHCEVKAIFNAKENKIVGDNPEIWSRQFGVFHTRVAEALLDLYDLTKVDDYLNKAKGICRTSLKFQLSSGNFETSPGITELHPLLYGVEGLLYVGLKTKETDFVDAAKHALEWAFHHCYDGEIPQRVDSSTGTALSRFRTDSLAQGLSIAADLIQNGSLKENYAKKMDELALKILSMKSKQSNFFKYGYYEKYVNGKLISNTRSFWTNMLCFQALFKYYLTSLLSRTKLVILAGGKGNRCWPISSESTPKPFTKTFLGDRSLFQETVRRYSRNFVVHPYQIYVVCNIKAVENVNQQATAEGIPLSNIILENEPLGTISSLNLALRKICSNNEDSLIVVSLADNIIDPIYNFQKALVSSIIIANDYNCIVTIGKKININKEKDPRFGHLLFKENDRINSYQVYKASIFKPKPNLSTINKMKALPYNFAWECGTLVFRYDCYKKIAPINGNIDADILSKATPWLSKPKFNKVRMAVSILDSDTKFNDFGTLCSNLKSFYYNTRFDYENGNICLNNKSNMNMVSCSGNFIIMDKCEIEACDLSNYLIVENSASNITVILPLSESGSLGFFKNQIVTVCSRNNLFKNCKYNHFPSAIVFDSPDVIALSEYGMLCTFRCHEPLFIHRTKERLVVKLLKSSSQYL